MTVLAICALVAGLAFGIFILVRLRADPVEDKEDDERRRSIEEGLTEDHQQDRDASQPQSVCEANAEPQTMRCTAIAARDS
jgi:hypothetical protein